MVRCYPIQGVLLGFEWDWDSKWFSLNLLVVKVVVIYGRLDEFDILDRIFKKS
jgi:hypothetical protein